MEVFSFTKESFYETGLTHRNLINRKSFRVDLKDLPFNYATASALSGETLSNDCFIPEKMLSIERGSKSKTVTVRGYFYSPFAYIPDPKYSGKPISKWVSDCHCSSPSEEVEEKCFSDRLTNSIARELENANDFKSKNGDLAVITQEARYRIAQEVRMPFGSFDVLLNRDRGLTKQGDQNVYFGQRLNPGEMLCFQGSTHAVTWKSKLRVMVNTSEPMLPACFGWGTLVRARYRQVQVDNAVGIDPLSRWSNPWATTKAKIYAESRNDDRTLVSVDGIARSDDTPYRFAMLFTKNEEFLLPNGPERDFTIHKDGVPLPTDGEVFRGSFLLLIRDARLMDFIRKRISDKSDKCGVNNFTLGDEDLIHDYLSCLTTAWGTAVGIPAPITVDEWLYDIVFPSNSRPFVSFEILINENPVQVRTGETLLNLIDRRIGLSSEIFQLRSISHNTNVAMIPTLTEQDLVTRVVKLLRFERRNGIYTVPVGLNRANQLEDLLIPLKSGDQLTWLD